MRGNSLSEGDVILMHSESKLRGFWKFLGVQKLIKRHNGHVMTVVRVLSNEGKTTVLRRPLKSLYSLECSRRDDKQNSAGEISAIDKKNDETYRRMN